jgi:ribokinase
MSVILNFGSLNIDHVYQVRAFVRPGETISSTGYDRVPGGKGLNQSVALARAGAPVFHAGKVGEDGLFLVQLLESCGVNTTYTARSGSVTGHACIQVDASGQNCILLLGGANQEITEEDVENTLSAFHAGDWLVLQNEISCMPQILSAGKATGMVTVLNPSPITPALAAMDLSAVDYLLLNETEGRDLTGETEPAAITAALLEKYPAMKVVLTLGGDGAVYAAGEEYIPVPACPTKAVDTTAAGDTFTGYFIAAVSAGMDPETAMRRASKAASIAVSRPGASVSIPTLEEVD